MKQFFNTIAIIVVLIFSVQAGYSQVDSTIQLCQKQITLPFISDGQVYSAFLNGDEVAEFHVTFYGESTYRIAAYSGVSEGNLIFSLYDVDKNLLFTNKDYQNAAYWDFKFDNTVDCIIEATLEPKNLTTGIAVVLIGFQQ